MPRISRLKAPSLLRTAPLRGEASKPQSVDRGKNVIRGYAVVTRGEALGHGFWLDSEFLDQVVHAGNEAPNGIRSRFTHPGLCEDGLGKLLGRTRNFVRDGDVVRGDLHLADVAKNAPGLGDLASYVMDLAEEDPEAFGASIVFAHDMGEEDRHRAQFEDEEGDFVSPDSENKENYVHARLAQLRASDVVDTPAANPGGFFSGGDEFAARAETALAYALGLSEHVPAELFGGVEAARVRAFVEGFMQRHELKLMRKGDSAMPISRGVTPSKGKALAEEEEPKEEKETKGEGEEEEEQEEEPKETEQRARTLKSKPGEFEAIKLPSIATLAELKGEFSDAPAFVLEMLEKGVTLEEAKGEFARRENALLRQRVERLEKANAVEGASPLSHGGGSGEEAAPEGTFLEVAKAHAKENKLSLAEAMSACAAKYPSLYEKSKFNHEKPVAQGKLARSARR